MTKTLSMQDLRKRPRAVRAMLSRNEHAVLTAKEKPIAILLPVTAETFESTLELVQRVQLMRAVDVMRARAARMGTNKMTMAEIDEVIAEARREARTRKQRRIRY
jgi:hypothetical protein